MKKAVIGVIIAGVIVLSGLGYRAYATTGFGSGIATGYMKMQTTIVDSAVKVMDKCTEALFSKEGETLEETKERLRK